MKLFLLFMILIISTFSAQAEYRVFLLNITKESPNIPPNISPIQPQGQQQQQPQLQTSPQPQSQQPPQTETPATTANSSNSLQNPTEQTQSKPNQRQVLSTLDPMQYPTYFPLEKGETITYVETWKCDGRTQGKDFCPNPNKATTQLQSTIQTQQTSTPNPPRVPASP